MARGAQNMGHEWEQFATENPAVAAAIRDNYAVALAAIRGAIIGIPGGPTAMFGNALIQASATKLTQEAVGVVIESVDKATDGGVSYVVETSFNTGVNTLMAANPNMTEGEARALVKVTFLGVQDLRPEVRSMVNAITTNVTKKSLQKAGDKVISEVGKKAVQQTGEQIVEQSGKQTAKAVAEEVKQQATEQSGKGPKKVDPNATKNVKKPLDQALETGKIGGEKTKKVDIRSVPGEAVGGEKLPVIVDGSTMFLGYEQKIVSKVPGQVAEAMRGKEFKNWDHFRREFWKTMAADPQMQKRFSEANLKYLRKGLAP